MILEHPTDEMILGWVTGELVGDAATLLESHVASCPACAARLADEAALDVVMHAAGELDAFALDEVECRDEEPEVVELAAPAVEPRRAATAWKQVLAAAAGFGLLIVTGPNRPRTAVIDGVEPAMAGAVAIPDEPTSFGDDANGPDCDPEVADDGPVCTEDSLFAMAGGGDPAPWSVDASWELASMPRETLCTTPVDTGESLTCDDWLSDDELSG